MITNEQTINDPCILINHPRVLVGSMFLLKSSDAHIQELTIVINSKDAEKANAHAVRSQAHDP